MADVITNINSGMVGYFKNIKFLSIIGWIIFIIVIICALFWFLTYYKNKRLFNKLIVVHEIVNGEFIETYRDQARSIKLGSGGFEIIFLKKLKTWKLAMGARTGRNRYDFYIMPDGYWYPAKVYANIFKIDELKGMIPVVTTNASMRSQYTSLEKQIDVLHQDKKSFMDKWGTMLFGLGFLLVAGVMLWLNYQEFVKATANLATAISKAGELIDKINVLQGNSASVNNGLVPIK